MPTNGADSGLMTGASFAKRLEIACDNHPLVPPHNYGRQTWIVNELEKQFDVKVSKETVRKWFAGEARPRPDKMRVLAELLYVDEAWLSLGTQAAAAEGSRLRVATADGVVSLVIGMLTLSGASCAFPARTDPRLKSIHFYAILRGGHFGVYVSLGEKAQGSITFILPKDCEHTLMIGVVKRTPIRYDLYHLTPSAAFKFGVQRTGCIELTGTDNGGMIRVKEETLNTIEDFHALG